MPRRHQAPFHLPKGGKAGRSSGTVRARRVRTPQPVQTKFDTAPARTSRCVLATTSSSLTSRQSGAPAARMPSVLVSQMIIVARCCSPRGGSPMTPTEWPQASSSCRGRLEESRTVFSCLFSGNPKMHSSDLWCSKNAASPRCSQVNARVLNTIAGTTGV